MKVTTKTMSETAFDAEASLKLAIGYIPTGLAVFDRDLSLVTSNAQYRELLDLPEHLIAPGVPLYTIALYLARRGDLGVGEPTRLAALRLGELTSNETNVSQRPGQEGKTLEFHSSRTPDGGLVITFFDVTARVRAERELERMNLSLEGRVEERTAALTQVNSELEVARAKADAANLDKTRFLAAASHDLLQPLNAARLYTATLIERAGEGETASLAHSIEASLNAVEEIMSALLDISRIDSGAVKPVPAPFNVRDLMRKIEVEFQPLAQEKDIKLKLVGSSLTVVSDRQLVARIVQNLVSNAIKYTRPGGKVLVGCRRRGARVRLDIIDTGIGFNKDQHALVFAEFSRLEQGARMAQGLGLGLSIVQRLVATLGVSLELDSAEGKGSRFSLYLPQSRTVRALPEGDRRMATNTGGTLNLRVLCVDNERAILDAMEGLLRGWGCDVRTARSLKDISRDGLLEGWMPDMVLMDYHLDQTSGLDAIEWLRHNVGGHLPAALVTADRSPAVRTLAEDRGIAVITKPVKPAALRATIAGLAGQRGRQADSRPASSASN
ncbi:ATP-binding response regulator [Paradevosia shaoguanensis]|uniref:histidine kinase n=1 Tax=Paradevosia shaoguanensis TaxID=1335043 RepID=A0AA41U9Z8_9HYPH|nr:PAS-domain containing protein [Paradevosia shaoguanensis]MCF1741422.1 PAS-domain containing protein [Paradevosia shaoguanensis]MCI0125905.1 PAS-domain containing protein [Paradevosia shaoguanensis]QMV03192.1 response regulator [Devosia sp. D6-9]CDP51254.1 Na+/proline symporter / Sensor histidine kinase Pr lS [Devosia sp. DBB001]